MTGSLLQLTLCPGQEVRGEQGLSPGGIRWHLCPAEQSLGEVRWEDSQGVHEGDPPMTLPAEALQSGLGTLPAVLHHRKPQELGAGTSYRRGQVGRPAASELSFSCTPWFRPHPGEPADLQTSETELHLSVLLTAAPSPHPGGKIASFPWSCSTSARALVISDYSYFKYAHFLCQSAGLLCAEIVC